MGTLTVLQVKHLQPKKKLYGVADGDGLSIQVSPAGNKSWLYRYRLDGKQKNYTLGTFPELSLADARRELLKAKDLVAQGISPVKKRNTERETNRLKEQLKKVAVGNTFESVAREWHDVKKHTWTATHENAVLQSLINHAFPYIGDVPIDLLKPPEVLLVIRRIESQGVHDMAKRVLQRISAACRYAIQTGRATYNPAADMKGALAGPPKGSVRNFSALTLEMVPQYLRDLRKGDINIITQAAMRFILLTASRTIEVRSARWCDLDLEAGTWNIERTKNDLPHQEMLSRQSLEVIDSMRPFACGKRGFIFPGIRDHSRMMSENTLLYGCIYRLGYHSRTTVHGFRHLFSTAANETGFFPPDIIERQLAHVDRNKVRAIYNKAQYAEQRRVMMQWWADWLDAMEDAGCVVPAEDYLKR